MKKIISIFSVMGLVLAFGTAYAGIDTAGSLLRSIDPSSVPGYVDMETGAATLAPTAIFTTGASAAGGISIEADTFLNYVDPSKVAGYVDPETGAVNKRERTIVTRGSAAGGIRMETDTFLNFIDPRRLPGYVDMETGVIN